MDPIKCILLVDDDHSANFITRRVISRMDCAEEILVAMNGLEALEIIQERCQSDTIKPFPQLILLDLKMPVMDGFEFLKNFEQLPLAVDKRPVIIMLSTSTNPQDLQMAQDFKINEFLNKPLKVNEMEHLLEKYFKPEQSASLQVPS